MKTLMIMTLSLVLVGCAGIQGQRAVEQTPEFDLFEFFDGRVLAVGIVQDRSGNVIQRFEASIDGTVQGDQLTLDERFTYWQGDGPSERVWTINQTDQGFVGSATDIPGPATGKSYGNALNWQYAMDLPYGDGTIGVRFDDWFWALDQKRMMNRSYIKKFGLTVAEVTLYMERLDQ